MVASPLQQFHGSRDSPTKIITMQQLHQAIINHVENSLTTVNNLSLFSGVSGYLVYLLKATEFPELTVNETIIEEQLDKLQYNLNYFQREFSLSSGIIGLGWFLEYANQSQEEDYLAELCVDIDHIIHQHLLTNYWTREIEMVMGLAGVSVYAARRQLKSDQSRIYNELVRHFEQVATYFENGTLAWNQPPYSVYRLNKEQLHEDEYNLGLAHGVPGIIASLLPALEIPEISKRASTLVVKSCDWLLRQQYDSVDSVCYYPSYSNGKDISRLGWCYGDLTIALTLVRTGKALNKKNYIEIARNISLRAASRDVTTTLIADAGICHGSVGLALLFKLLYAHFRENDLLQASNFWRDHTLTLFKVNGLAGLYKYNGVTKQHEECDGFLEGYAGIGLTLLSLENNQLDWTDSLLLS